MKIRSGFVSNSSSSSFVIGFKVDMLCKHCGRKDPDIISLIENASNFNDDNSVSAVGFDEVMTYLDSGYGSQEIDDVQSYHVTHPDDTVAIVNISYHDEALRSMLFDSKSIHIIVNNGE